MILSEAKSEEFKNELEALADYILRAKTEIASIQPVDISTNHIPLATDELDAVVGATEEATNKIMDVCDNISAISENLPQDKKDQLIACTTAIFEACNFQDITGQRITKVVNTLKHIDEKINALLGVLGERLHPPRPAKHVASISTNDPASLLNGPQLPGQAIKQDEIDRLMDGK